MNFCRSVLARRVYPAAQRVCAVCLSVLFARACVFVFRDAVAEQGGATFPEGQEGGRVCHPVSPPPQPCGCHRRCVRALVSVGVGVSFAGLRYLGSVGRVMRSHTKHSVTRVFPGNGLVCVCFSASLVLLAAAAACAWALSNGRSVRIESIDVAKREIVVLGLDCIEGTPVLDIKPYLPCMYLMVP